MATRFFEEAQSQLAPVYDQQEAALTGQIPSIQKLYDTLISGLQGQFDTSLQTGTQNIVEDASRRGVLRSTLPVDARQALTGQLSQALLEGRSKLELNRVGDIGAINEKVGNLKINRAGSIADLARTLESQDLERQKFEFTKEESARSFELEKQKLAIQAQAAAKASQAAVEKGAPQGLVRSISNYFATNKGADGFVSPETYKRAMQGWINEGGSPTSFHETYGGFINPVHQAQWGGYY